MFSASMASYRMKVGFLCFVICFLGVFFIFSVVLQLVKKYNDA